MNEYSLGFVGFGHMAQIMLQAIDAAHLIPRSKIQFIQRDPSKMKRNEQKYGITSTSMERLVSSSDLILLGVRPAQAEAAALEMAKYGSHEKKIISILAGVPIQFFKKHFPEGQILRVMPNVASAVGEGMTILSYSPDANTEFRSATHTLMSPLGPSMELPEKLIDAATGLAGSGPGFVFKLIQAMAHAGEKQGIPRDQALKMAAQTFLGSAKLVLSGADLSSLLVQIATPGGTTEAGFQVMDKTEIGKHLQETIEASIHKAKFFSEKYI